MNSGGIVLDCLVMFIFSLQYDVASQLSVYTYMIRWNCKLADLL